MDAFTLVARLTLNRDDFNTGMAQVEGDLKSDKMTSPFSAWGVTVGNLASQAFTRVFRAGVDFAKSIVTTGMSFESIMDKVFSVRYADITQEQFEELTKKAINLGASTKFTAEEVGEAFFYMAIAGWKADEMLSGIDGVLNLAAASGEDLGRVSDIVTDAITAMGLKADATTNFVNVLAAAASNSNTTVGQMGEAFKYLATTGGVLQYSIEDVASVLGLLANNGIKASQAGTSMRKILNTLIAPTEDAQKAMDALNISLFESDQNGKSGQRKPLMQVVEELRDVFKQSGLNLLEGFSADEITKKIEEVDAWYDAEQKRISELNLNAKMTKQMMKDLDKQYAEKLFGAQNPNQDFLAKLSDIGGLRGISSLFALMKSTDEDVNQLVSAIAESGEGQGTAAEMAGIMLDNLKGDVTILNSAVESLKIAMYEDINPQARQFVQSITEGVQKLTNFIRHGQAEWTAEDAEKEAVAEAQATAAEAQGIVSYMDSLIAKYGDAAKNSNEWADAMARLQQLIPDITSAIKEEGQELSTTTQSFSEYIEQHKQKAIQEAKEAYVADLRKQYDAANVELGKAQINQELSTYTQQEAARAMAEMYLSNRQAAELMNGTGYRAITDEFAAYNTVEEILDALKSGKAGLDSFMSYLEYSGDEFDVTTFTKLRETYEEAEQAYDTNKEQIAKLTDAAADLQVKLRVAEQAAERMAEQMAAVAIDTANAAETTRTAQVQFNNGIGRGRKTNVTGSAKYTTTGAEWGDVVNPLYGPNAIGAHHNYITGPFDISTLTGAITGAVRDGMKNVQVNAYLDGYRVTQQVSRIQNDQLQLAR